MTPKDALELILEYVNLDEYDYETKGIRNAETLLKQSLNEHEALKRDVARYFYLENLPDDKYTGDIGAEHRLLKEKLSKVGKE